MLYLPLLNLFFQHLISLTIHFVCSDYIEPFQMSSSIYFINIFTIQIYILILLFPRLLIISYQFVYFSSYQIGCVCVCLCMFVKIQLLQYWSQSSDVFDSLGISLWSLYYNMLWSSIFLGLCNSELEVLILYP